MTLVAHLLESPEKEALELHVPLHEAVEHDPGLLLVLPTGDKVLPR
jgi:hypothetical protein